MNIIKKIILKNRLKAQLQNVEKELQKNDYERLKYELDKNIYHPDAYAVIYEEIQNKCGKLLNTKIILEEQIRDLSGKNLFKKIDEHSLTK